MDKATPTPPATVDSFMSLLRNHENRISETYGVLQDRKIPSEEVRAAIDASSEARNALIAEVERLAAQAAPTEQWIDDPHDIEGGRMLNPAWLKAHGFSSAKEYVAAQAPVVQASWPQEEQPDGTVNAVDPADMGASSGAAQAAPFAKDSWQHAVDNQLVGFGRTSQEFANPHEATAWLAEMHMELGVSNAGATQAVRMLTDADCREYLNGSWLTKDQDDAIAAFCAVNAGRTIPADGVIGGV